MEAGDEEPLIMEIPAMQTLSVQSSIDYNYVLSTDCKVCNTEGKKNLTVPRGKVMGGSSSINGMMYVRGNKQDYDNWAQLGNDGWSYEEILPYFKKSENARDPRVSRELVFA